MLTYNTAELTSETVDAMSREEILWVYNGLDCMLTHEIESTITPLMDDNAKLISNFEHAMQAPALDMSFRGIRINLNKRDELVSNIKARCDHLRDILNKYAKAIWKQPCSISSPAQCQKLIKFMGYKIPKINDKGVWRESLNAETLNKLKLEYWLEPICLVILKFRELDKLRQTLETSVDSDGFMRTMYNVAGTETGRWSSKANAFDSGTNLQNITDRIREIFVSEPGHMMAYIDLEQAESRIVAYISNDENYIKACESGDLHSTVCRMIWPDLAWDTAPDKVICDQDKFFRHFTHRDMAKRGGHGTNYYGKAPTMAKHLSMPIPTIAEFQEKYFRAFPGIREWHIEVAGQLHTTNRITTALGRTRRFWGHPADDATLREAIAYEPQSIVGDILNLGMWRCWRYAKEFKLLAQVHDAILIQFKEDRIEEALAEAMELIQVPVNIRGHEVIIPAAIEGVGWNWRKFNYKNPSENPDGLKKYDPSENRSRQVFPPTSILDRQLF